MHYQQPIQVLYRVAKNEEVKVSYSKNPLLLTQVALQVLNRIVVVITLHIDNKNLKFPFLVERADDISLSLPK